MASCRVYQFHAELADFRPKIWRRFQVRGDATMARLGYIVQVLFEMGASHLMAFELPVRKNARNHLIQNLGKERADQILSVRIIPEDYVDICRYEIPCDENNQETDYPANILTEDATLARIHHAVGNSGDLLDFYYDFGDGWHVNMKVEKVLKMEDSDPRGLPCVMGGKNFGIVEDIGGVTSLKQLVEAYREKTGAEYQHYIEWLQGKDFDIARFDIDDMNFRLKKIPRIYMQIYEQSLVPTRQSCDLISRKYRG